MLRLDPSSAVESYGRALEMDPSLANVWFNLANAHLKMGQEEEAARWWVRAINRVRSGLWLSLG